MTKRANNKEYKLQSKIDNQKVTEGFDGPFTGHQNVSKAPKTENK